MATHGSMAPFNPAGKESWTSYTERLGHYFTANKVTDAAQKRAILLSVCGPKTYKLIKSLADATAFPGMSCDQICTLLKDYYDPVPSETVQRYTESGPLEKPLLHTLRL